MPFNVEHIKEAFIGLLYLSETDSACEAFSLDASPADLQAKLLALAGKTNDRTFKVDTLPHFFRNLTKQQPEETTDQQRLKQRYQNLEQVLQEELPNVAVYLIGEVEVDAFILGSTGAGSYAGLRTQLVQT